METEMGSLIVKRETNLLSIVLKSLKKVKNRSKIWKQISTIRRKSLFQFQALWPFSQEWLPANPQKFQNLKKPNAMLLRQKLTLLPPKSNISTKNLNLDQTTLSSLRRKFAPINKSTIIAQILKLHTLTLNSWTLWRANKRFQSSSLSKSSISLKSVKRKTQLFCLLRQSWTLSKSKLLL